MGPSLFEFIFFPSLMLIEQDLDVLFNVSCVTNIKTVTTIGLPAGA
jgi:hypothetical protein